MLQKINAAAVIGIDAFRIIVEVDMALGLPGFFIVGMPNVAVRESKIRVQAALKNCGFKLPQRKILVNLSPADIRKDGTGYDLAIAIGVLSAAGEISQQETVANTMILGELSLSGEILPIKGALPIVMLAKNLGLKNIILPTQNYSEGLIINRINVVPVSTLKQVVDFINKRKRVCFLGGGKPPQQLQGNEQPDFAEVQGQTIAKRAVEVAAAGGHNLLFLGPPGSGKTMLARRIPSILPKLEFEEALETTKIYSVSGRLPQQSGLLEKRPFRNPHHTISDIALIGGGVNPVPGEISLAHGGVLFLDELLEFKKHVLEVLRQPLEEKKVFITRLKSKVTFPANVMLVAALNPCPCGYLFHAKRRCHCRPHQIQQYRSKLSGPLVDRIDIHVEVTALQYKQMKFSSQQENSATIRKRVVLARDIQKHRFRSLRIYCNAQMNKRHQLTFCQLNKACHEYLEKIVNHFGLSARTVDRIIKVARTVADLDQSTHIKPYHLSEAFQYRLLDREISWG